MMKQVNSYGIREEGYGFEKCLGGGSYRIWCWLNLGGDRGEIEVWIFFLIY